MTIKNDSYANARISYDGDIREVRDSPIPLFRMETESTTLWFVADTEFAINGNDFSIRISKFGLRRRAAAGSTGSMWQQEIDAKAVDFIRSRLTSFFMEDEKKPFGPFVFNRGKCQSVVFSDDWIRCK